MTRGALSRYLPSSRSTHRSPGSVICESAEITCCAVIVGSPLNGLSRLLKTPRSPFDKLRVNGSDVELVEDFPFVLSLSKHANNFCSNLLRCELSGAQDLPR